ncbi:MAG: hypothetical protein AAFV80_05770, partial [Bacteroidota bacterium]
AYLLANERKSGELAVTYSYGRSPDKEIMLIPVYEANSRSINIADFYSEAEFEVPYLGKQAPFNARTDAKVQERMQLFLSTRDSLLEGLNGALEPSLRMDIRSYSFFKCFYLSADLASFQVTFQSTHHQVENLALNYNLETGSFFELNDLFMLPGAGQNFIESYIIQTAKDLPYAEDPNFMSFLATKPFKHFGFNSAGIVIYTDFNGLYGSIAIPIPHEALRPYLKEDHPLQKLF